MSAVVGSPLPSAVNTKLISLIASYAIGAGILLSGFVIREPAPYEVYMAGLIAMWAMFGLRISRTVMTLLVLLVAFNIGGMIAMTQMEDLASTPLYLAVSLFLAFTAVFVAAVTEAQPGLFRVIFLAYTIAAVATATLGVAGYFNLFPGTEIFTKFGRAAGAFEDPNVFGPFLTLPAMYLLYRMMTGRLALMPFYAIPLAITAAGVFLSFSRGAWGLFIVSGVMLVAALFIQTKSGKLRLRIVMTSIAVLAAMVLVVLIILQIPSVADLFTARAQLVQEYDGARLGRFARYFIGFQLALEHPLGIGPLVFGTIYTEDTHNIWLKALMDYGWLGFASYLVLMALTVAGGFRILFRNRPWQPYLLCAYVTMLGHIGLGTVIDTDHWRHFYLLLGLVWGAMALEARQQRATRSARNELLHSPLRATGSPYRGGERYAVRRDVHAPRL